MTTPPVEDSTEPQEKIFRDNALENQFQLDSLLVVVQRKEWITFGVLTFLVLFFLFWIFLGSLPVTVTGKGIILDLSQMRTLQSRVDGHISKIFVNNGDNVSEGQIIVEIDNPIVLLEKELLMINYQIFVDEYNELKSQIAKEKELHVQALQQQQQSLAIAKNNKEKEIELLNQTLETEEALFRKNLLSLPSVNRTRLERLGAITALATIETEQKKNLQEQTKQYRLEDLWSKGSSLREAERLFSKAQLLYDETLIKAPWDGVVINNFVYQGEAIQNASPLITLQKKEVSNIVPNYFYAYLPEDTGKGILIDMEVHVELSKYILRKYGSILGIVKDVSIIPISETEILGKLFNANLAKSFGKDNVLQVIVELLKDPSTPSGYKWTSGMGPPHAVTIGNTGTANIIVDRIAPIYYLLPDWNTRNVHD